MTWLARCPACGADAVWTASATTTAVDCDCDNDFRSGEGEAPGRDSFGGAA